MILLKYVFRFDFLEKNKRVEVLVKRLPLFLFVQEMDEKEKWLKVESGVNKERKI